MKKTKKKEELEWHSYYIKHTKVCLSIIIISPYNHYQSTVSTSASCDRSGSIQQHWKIEDFFENNFFSLVQYYRVISDFFFCFQHLIQIFVAKELRKYELTKQKMKSSSSLSILQILIFTIIILATYGMYKRRFLIENLCWEIINHNYITLWSSFCHWIR